MQYPFELEPSELWNCSKNGKWIDISDQYEDLFFRVNGKKTAEFGTVQQESFSKIDKVMRYTCLYGNCDYGSASIDIVANNWSDKIYTGSENKEGLRFLQFHQSSSELRPRNMAIRLWKCVEK